MRSYRYLIAALVTLVAWPAGAETARIEVSEVARMVDICRQVEPADQISVEGNAFERGQQRDAHRRQREEALGRLYVVDIPASAYEFLEYDMRAQELRVDTSAGLRAHEGRTALLLREHDTVLASVTPAQARRLAELQQRGELVLRLGFYLHPSAPEATPCALPRTPDVPVRVEVELAFFELRHGDAGALVRVGPGGDGGASWSAGAGTAPPSSDPAVTLSRPSVNTEGDLDELIQGPAGEQLRQRFLQCYRSRLETRPGLEGMVVVQLVVAGGQVRSAHLEIDSLGDPMIGACVMRQVRAYPYPRNVHGGVSLPIQFEP